MSISDLVGTELDPDLEEIVVMFNATDEPQNYVMGDSAAREWGLHPVQHASAEPA